MARAATTTDAFNAVAEPRRREILDLLAGGERSVTELVESLGLSQPLVSKHLRVLREVGLVRVRDEGKPLRSIATWLAPFERAMSGRFDLMDDVIAELKAQEEENDGDDDQIGQGHASG